MFESDNVGFGDGYDSSSIVLVDRWCRGGECLSPQRTEWPETLIYIGTDDYVVAISLHAFKDVSLADV